MQNQNPSTDTTSKSNDPAQNLDPITKTSIGSKTKGGAIAAGLEEQIRKRMAWKREAVIDPCFQIGWLASIAASLTSKDRGERERAKQEVRECAKLGGWKT